MKTSVLKKVIITLYILILVVMATATIVEKMYGTSTAHTAIYGSWWFVVLWGLLALAGIVGLVRSGVRHVGTLSIHASLVLILIGALLTHLTSYRGMIHLRLGETVNTYVRGDGDKGMKLEKLPFSLRLDRFETHYHEGTSAVADYESRFTVIDGQQREEAEVSMNHIYSHRHIRFYQASYDEDGRGSVLSINSDPWGIPVTYAGYVLLFLSLIWMLIDPRGAYRRVLRSPLLKKGALITLLLLTLSIQAGAQTTLPRETADRFGRVLMLYNDRICPVQTYALDFCKKVYGARSYKGLTAEQVLAGWIFYGNNWTSEPFIKVKGGALRKQLSLPEYCSVGNFFIMGNYNLGPLVQEYYQGNHDKVHQQAADLDGKLMLIMELRGGSTLKMLPYTGALPKGGRTVTTWYSPVDSLPASVEPQHARYIRSVFPLIAEDVQAQRWSRVDEFFDRMLRYQEVSAGNSLPTKAQYRAERINNAVPFASILFMANLTLGLVAFILFIITSTRKTGREDSRRRSRLFTFLILRQGWEKIGQVLMLLSFLTLTLTLALRWTISGNIPLSNGYETMLSVAWFVQLIALLVMHRFPIIMVFGFLLSGFFLLVSHINQMDPAIGQMMPVLNSPLLSIHVSIIMMSYALLSLTFLCAVVGLLRRRLAAPMQALSRVFLYPAITTLGIGIFMGAIWANVSWGTYWSWDSKETWALITFMLYAVPLHARSLPALSRPRVYHWYLLLAFLSIIMTYFGVNYILGGMHSYA